MLEKDIEILNIKVNDTISQQQKAIEKEDYEEADQLHAKYTQTRNLIQAKEQQIKRLDEDYMVYENKKGDKYKDLSTLIHKSLEKIGELKTKQQEEMEQFEDTELNAIEEKKKRLHYESIRIEEIRKENKEARDKINHSL